MKKFIKFYENGEPASLVQTTVQELPDYEELSIDFYDQSISNLFKLPSGEIIVRPDRPFDGKVYNWDPLSSSWVIDISSEKSKKSREIAESCRGQIIGGFNSTALGAPHHYPSDETDQLNISGTVQKALISPPEEIFLFLCADENMNWEYRPHTSEQIKQVGTDVYNHIIAARVKNATLQAQIQSAATVEDLNLIVW